MRFRRGRWLFFAFGFDCFAAFFFSKNHPLSTIEALPHLAPLFPVDFKIRASTQRTFQFHQIPHLLARGPRKRATWPRLERYVCIRDFERLSPIGNQWKSDRANGVL